MVSRQRLYQIQQRELGNCMICGQPALPKKNRNNKYPTGAYCEFHRHQANERCKSYYQYKKPYKIPFIRVK